MHDDIIRFEREGYTDNNAQTREWYIDEVEKEMRDKGLVPSIDNAPQYTVEYLPSEGCFYFTLSVYGVKVGRDEAWDISGVTNGKRIMKYTHPTKSRES